jgi:hypothetical protein
MKFAEAYELMKQGKKIKVPEWQGYWYWERYEKTIVIHLKDGTDMDIRTTLDVDFTFGFICREDWIAFD